MVHGHPTAPYPSKRKQKNAGPCYHVKGMQSGHHEIEPEIKDLALGTREKRVCVGIQAVFELRAPLDGLDNKKCNGKAYGRQDEKPGPFGTVLPERMHRQNHRKAARNEKCGVQCAEKT